MKTARVANNRIIQHAQARILYGNCPGNLFAQIVSGQGLHRGVFADNQIPAPGGDIQAAIIQAIGRSIGGIIANPGAHLLA